MLKLYCFNKQYILHHRRCFDVPFLIKKCGLLTALFIRMIEENRTGRKLLTATVYEIKMLLYNIVHSNNVFHIVS